MKIRIAVIAVVLVLIVTVLILRAPRIKPHAWLTTKSRVHGNQFTSEFRMNEPFELILEHCQHAPPGYSDSTGITVRISPNRRTESVAKVKSKHSLLRGEHYVNVRLERGKTLLVKANGMKLEICPWLAPDASGAQWCPSCPGRQLHDGVEIPLVDFVSNSDAVEALVITATTYPEYGEE